MPESVPQCVYHRSTLVVSIFDSTTDTMTGKIFPRTMKPEVMVGS